MMAVLNPGRSPVAATPSVFVLCRRYSGIRTRLTLRRRLTGATLHRKPGEALRLVHRAATGENPIGGDDIGEARRVMQELTGGGGEGDSDEEWDEERDREELERLTAQFNAYMDGEEDTVDADEEWLEEGEEEDDDDEEGYSAEDRWAADIEMRESAAEAGEFGVDEAELERNADYYEMIAEGSAAAADLDPEGRALSPEEAELMEQAIQSGGRLAGPLPVGTSRFSQDDLPEVPVSAIKRALAAPPSLCLQHLTIHYVDDFKPPQCEDF
jgi:hypothetical protein